jgi:hypothetical protein
MRSAAVRSSIAGADDGRYLVVDSPEQATIQESPLGEAGIVEEVVFMRGGAASMDVEGGY